MPIKKLVPSPKDSLLKPQFSRKLSPKTPTPFSEMQSLALLFKISASYLLTSKAVEKKLTITKEIPTPAIIMDKNHPSPIIFAFLERNKLLGISFLLSLFSNGNNQNIWISRAKCWLINFQITKKFKTIPF